MKKLNIEREGLAMLVHGSPAGIIAQEKAGQREVVAGAKEFKVQLPKDCSEECKKALEAAGVKFWETVDGDALFRHAVLPEGWTIKPTDHDMYSDLLDAQGRKRASIGYKAAFYDRWANLSACRRFEPGYSKEDWGDSNSDVFPCIKDGGTIVWRGKTMKDTREVEGLPIKQQKDDEVGVYKGGTYPEIVFPSDYCRKFAVSKLSALYPEWDSMTAYWDITPTWPESESKPLEGQEYRLHVSLYHANGNFSDSGSQTTRIAKTDAEGVKKLRADCVKAFGGRYKVVAQVTCGERVVEKFTIELPAPKPERRISSNGYYNGFDDDRHYRRAW